MQMETVMIQLFIRRKANKELVELAQRMSVARGFLSSLGVLYPQQIEVGALIRAYFTTNLSPANKKFAGELLQRYLEHVEENDGRRVAGALVKWTQSVVEDYDGWVLKMRKLYQK